MVLMKLLPDQPSVCGGWFGFPPRPRMRDFDGWGGAGALIGLFRGSFPFFFVPLSPDGPVQWAFFRVRRSVARAPRLPSSVYRGTAR